VRYEFIVKDCVTCDVADELPEPVPGLLWTVHEAEEQEPLARLVEGLEDIALDVFRYAKRQVGFSRYR